MHAIRIGQLAGNQQAGCDGATQHHWLHSFTLQSIREKKSNEIAPAALATTSSTCPGACWRVGNSTHAQNLYTDSDTLRLVKASKQPDLDANFV